MHEASLINDLIRKVQDLCDSRGGGRVTTVQVRLGALSHMSPDHFRHHFSQASAGTIAEGATLQIEESTELDDPNAQGLLLLGVEIET